MSYIVISVALHVESGNFLCRYDPLCFPPCSSINLLLPCMLTVQQQPAARSPSSFVTAHLCAQRGGDAAATADHARPHTAPALMRCSCFQIQPLILILFLLLNMAPKGTSDPVVFLCFLSNSSVYRRLRDNITKGRY